MSIQSFSVFKVLNIDTGKFSIGGSSPRWSKEGKTWSSAGALRRHLNLVATLGTGYNFKLSNIPDNWMVLQVDIDADQWTTNMTLSSARDFYEAKA